MGSGVEGEGIKEQQVIEYTEVARKDNKLEHTRAFYEWDSTSEKYFGSFPALKSLIYMLKSSYSMKSST